MNVLVENMESPDHDLRFMAANDLLVELEKESFGLDDAMEKKLVIHVLKLLQDTNSEVQQIAIKVLAPLMTGIRETNHISLVTQVAALLTSEDGIVRDVAGVGLKAIINHAPVGGVLAKKLISILVPKMILILSGVLTP